MKLHETNTFGCFLPTPPRFLQWPRLGSRVRPDMKVMELTLKERVTIGRLIRLKKV